MVGGLHLGVPCHVETMSWNCERVIPLNGPKWMFAEILILFFGLLAILFVYNYLFTLSSIPILLRVKIISDFWMVKKGGSKTT